MKKMFRLLIVVGLAIGASIAQGEAIASPDEIKTRISPVGSICLSGEKCAAAPAPVAAAGPKSGKEVFAGFCTTCHASGVMGAPKIGTAADWAARIAKGKETLYTHALNGFNSMPPKGMCAACSNEEIQAAVDYMLDNSK